MRGYHRVHNCKHFNPRSHKGSDTNAVGLCIVGQLFQSTLPQGERRIPHLTEYYRVAISIHAPTRGATVFGIREYYGISNFNPRSHKGSDNTLNPIKTIIEDFNPRSHKGSDRAGDGIIQVSIYFNPRSHKGSDSNATSEKLSSQEFQSTLPQGERRRL